MIDRERLKAHEPNETFHEQQLAAELFKLRVRRDAKRLMEEEDKTSPEVAIGDMPLVYAPLPDSPPELMPGLIPESGTAAIVGETNTGKSAVSLEIASSLLTGEPLWGHIYPTKKIQRVTYVLGEHTCQTLQGLFHRMKLPHQGDFRLVGPEHLHPLKALVIGGVQQTLAVERMCRWTEGSQLIVFDPLAGFVQGDGAENDNATMRTLIDSMSYVATKSGAACLILSHAGKPKMDEKGTEIRRTAYQTRGASSIEDALTHIFYLRRPAMVRQQASEDILELAVRKYKGSPSSDHFRLRRDPETIRHTLTNPPRDKRSGLSIDQKQALNDKVARLQASNPKMDLDTIYRLLASAEGLPVATIKEWALAPLVR